MKLKIPMVRQVNWPTVAFQLVILIFLMWWLDVYLVLLVYFIVFLGMRLLLTRQHRKGIKLLRCAKFDDAIVCFENTYDFFNKHTLLNKYIPLIISANKITYKEMAMLNIAYCYILKKDGKKAKEIYEETLLEYPNSMIARSSLNAFEAMKTV